MKHLLLQAALLVCSFTALAQTTPPAAANGLATPDDLPPEPENCCQGKYARDSLGNRSTKALGQEYLRLNRIKCAACNFYGSDLFMIMKVLGVRLNGKSTAEIKRVMGRPDTVKGRVLVYYWRGEHDYLRFTPTKGRAVSSWYYALE